MSRVTKMQVSKLSMFAVGLALALSACGAEVPEGAAAPVMGAPELPSLPTVDAVPGGVQYLPPGYYVHDYPGVCVYLVRDADGEEKGCFAYPSELSCKPKLPGGCARFGF